MTICPRCNEWKLEYLEDTKVEMEGRNGKSVTASAKRYKCNTCGAKITVVK